MEACSGPCVCLGSAHVHVKGGRGGEEKYTKGAEMHWKEEGTPRQGAQPLSP